MGSARDDAELGLLLEEAQRLLVDDAQGELDLGITPKAVRAHMVPPPTATLFDDGAGDLASRQLVVRPRVLKSCNGLLCDTLAGIYASLGFDAVRDEVFRDLVIARVVEPTSLLDVDRVLAELGRTSAIQTDAHACSCDISLRLDPDQPLAGARWARPGWRIPTG